MEKPKVLTLDTSVFCDEEKFKAAYERVSDERRKKIDALCGDSDKRLSLGAGVLFEDGLKSFGIADGSLRYGDHKKPCLKTCDNLFFSLSHSGVMAVCAFYESEVGIDIEKIRKVPDSVMQKVTTEAEYNYLSGLCEEKKTTEFIRLWTVKESYIKYLGDGMNVISPQSLEVIFGKEITIMHSRKMADVTFEEYNKDGYKLTVCYGK